MEHGEHGSAILETMYPGYALGSGSELEWAMEHNLPLAVDVSHVFIQRTQGVLSERVLRAVFDYPHIAEVHVSANLGKHDSHLPIADTSFGIPWAIERHRSGTPTVLECYMHRLSEEERQRQVEALRC